MRRALPFVAAVLMVACVGSHPWAPSPPKPNATKPIPSDARALYRAMGFLSDSAGLRCVGSLRYLSAGTPDSTLAVLGVSLANRTLHFVPEGKGFVASYSVELAFRHRGTTVRDVEREETVRVSSSRETMRTDESILFQEFVAVPPGTYAVDAVVRDRNNPVVASVEVIDSVPQFTGPSLAEPLAVYESTGRAAERPLGSPTRAV